MIVTPQACRLALYRLFRQLRIKEARSQFEMQTLVSEWKQSCGLRLADLQRAIAALQLQGRLGRIDRDDGTTIIQLTDRGLMEIQRSSWLLVDFDWSAPIGSLLSGLQSDSILRRARRRYQQGTVRPAGIDSRFLERRKTA